MSLCAILCRRPELDPFINPVHKRPSPVSRADFPAFIRSSFLLLPPPLPAQTFGTHFLLPAVHRLLVILVRLEQQQVNHVQVLNMSVLFEVGSLLHSDHGGGDVECVEGADLRCLCEENGRQVVQRKWKGGMEGDLQLGTSLGRETTIVSSQSQTSPMSSTSLPVVRELSSLLVSRGVVQWNTSR